MAEALLNHHGAKTLKAFSAGSQPTGKVHPLALKTLEANSISTQGFHSKSWDNITQPVDLVVTVCGSAANENCPVFLNSALKTHWDVEDPAYFEGTEEEKHAEFLRVFKILEKRILAFLDLDEAERLHLAALTKIGSL